MANRAHDILFVFLVFLLQLALSRFVNLGAYVFICFIPLIITVIPLTDSPQRTMILSFAVALLFDFLSDGVMGLNSAAAVVAAALRKPLYRAFVNRDRQDKTSVPTAALVGTGKYLNYLTSVVAVYMLVYIALDCISFRPLSFVALKFLVSTIVNSALSLLVSVSFLNRR